MERLNMRKKLLSAALLCLFVTSLNLELKKQKAGITGVSSGFHKEDRLPVTVEEASGSRSTNHKLY
jgi:hypothetical protein